VLFLSEHHSSIDSIRNPVSLSQLLMVDKE